MRLFTIVIILLFVQRLTGLDIVFTEAIVQNQSSTIVPFQYHQSLIIVKAKVNEEEGNFILDTGASGLVLNSKYFKSIITEEASAYGLSGAVSEVGKSIVRDMEIDQMMFSRLSAEHIDLEEVEEKKKIKLLGLIGYDVIKNYEIMFNYREKFITFSTLGEDGEILQVLPHTTEKMDSFDFEMGNFIPVITVDVAGKPKRMGIDSGAEFNVIDNRKNRDILENFKITNRINISGADGRKKQAIAGLLYRVRLGEKYRCGSMPTMMTNMTSLNRIYETNLDGILGHSFLAPWIISINYKKKRMYIHKINFVKT